MLFAVTHNTKFSYSQPVFLEPHTVRLRPREDGSQKLLYFDMRVDPSPAGHTSCVDLEGNVTSRMWFESLVESLTIMAIFTVETLRTNPFDYILDPAALVLPMVYAEDVADVLAPYRSRAAPGDEVARFAEEIAREVDRNTVPFLSLLAERIHGMYEPIVREFGDAWPPPLTLASRQAACRDVAVLFMDACRALGLAARFISGYHEGDASRTERELHAWAEVYLPGVGWRGYDATRGIAVADRHVVVSAGQSSQGAAPTSGTFRGTGATSALHTSVRMMAVNALG